MKKIAIVCLTGSLFFTACENTGSSTVGTYEKDETTQSSDKKESETTTTDSLKTTNPGENKMDTMPSADSIK